MKNDRSKKCLSIIVNSVFKIRILSTGKTKESWLKEAIEEYVKRLKNVAEIEWHLVRDESLIELSALQETHVIALDPNGKGLDSPQFSTLLMRELEKGGSRLTFLIGGAEGLSDRIRNHFPTISLSPMTFTHQMTRLVLLEQIYRAFEIAKGSGYHK